MDNKFFFKVFSIGYRHACTGGKVEENPYPEDEHERNKLLHMAWYCGFEAYWERD